MKPADETELHRLTKLLGAIDREMDLTPDQSRAIKQGAIALSLVFIDGRRQRVEAMFDGIDKDLTADQLARLRELGLNPDG